MVYDKWVAGIENSAKRLGVGFEGADASSNELTFYLVLGSDNQPVMGKQRTPAISDDRFMNL